MFCHPRAFEISFLSYKTLGRFSCLNTNEGHPSCQHSTIIILELSSCPMRFSTFSQRLSPHPKSRGHADDSASVKNDCDCHLAILIAAPAGCNSCSTQFLSSIPLSSLSPWLLFNLFKYSISINNSLSLLFCLFLAFFLFFLSLHCPRSVCCLFSISLRNSLLIECAQSSQKMRHDLECQCLGRIKISRIYWNEEEVVEDTSSKRSRCFFGHRAWTSKLKREIKPDS